MGHVGPTQIKKKKNKIKKNGRDFCQQTENFIFYFFIFPLASLFDLRKSDRHNLSGEKAKCFTQRGLRVGTKNTGFHRVFN